jgi:hypothetical protein
MGWATFWAIFSQIHVVILLIHNSKCSYGHFEINAKVLGNTINNQSITKIFFIFYLQHWPGCALLISTPYTIHERMNNPNSTQIIMDYIVTFYFTAHRSMHRARVTTRLHESRPKCV